MVTTLARNVRSACWLGVTMHYPLGGLRRMAAGHDVVFELDLVVVAR
jgi:hypothetical protein